MPELKRGTPVLVRWRDSILTFGGWMTPEQIDEMFGSLSDTHWTCGFFYGEDETPDKKILIAQSTRDRGVQFANMIRIPYEAVVSVEQLYRAKPTSTP